jgi:hypothetical protein
VRWNSAALERWAFGARLPAEASAQAGSAPLVPFKKGSDFVKQTHQNRTFWFLEAISSVARKFAH